ncbi:hypothetical protein Pfo_001254 [Paulownia fortunei]|nr:hypothetical protein Pfo_001254 [Paulownia fortunei]
MGHSEWLPKLGSAKDLLLSGPVSELNVDEEADDPLQVLYTASFKNFLQKIYMLRKEIVSRKLYVTSKEIVYMVSIPSFIPFWGETKIEKHVPLSLVIDIVIEQGCLQSVYGLHTFRVENIAHGKAAPVDELQVQGVHNPGLLRKVILILTPTYFYVSYFAMMEKQDAGGSWNPNFQNAGGESMFRMESFTLGPAILESPSKGWKTIGSPLHAPIGPRVVVPTDLMLDKLEEVNKSVKKIEFLIEKNQAATGPSP